jgi:DNA-binding PucR family transcriptional regulator
MDVEPMLEALSRSPDLAPFRELVEPLAVYDRKRRGDLVRTLRVYLATGANAREAAERLFLHRNSLLYRLARIGELTGLDLKDPRVRLALQLGLLVVEDGERSLDDETKHP